MNVRMHEQLKQVSLYIYIYAYIHVYLCIYMEAYAYMYACTDVRVGYVKCFGIL